MTKEEILNNCRAEKGTSYDPNYWDAALNAMEIYASQYKEALEKIAHTVDYLQKEAEREGFRLNGQMAIQLSNDPNYLKKIAIDAIVFNNDFTVT